MTAPAHVGDLKGGCLCGTVRYQIDAGPLVDAGYCHCRLCQRASGAPVMAWLTLPGERFHILAGAPVAFRSSPRAVRRFCGRCGSPLTFEVDGDPRIDIAATSLDDPTAIAPEYHIWRMSRVPWFETTDTLPRHEGRGPDYA